MKTEALLVMVDGITRLLFDSLGLVCLVIDCYLISLYNIPLTQNANLACIPPRCHFASPHTSTTDTHHMSEQLTQEVLYQQVTSFATLAS